MAETQIGLVSDFKDGDKRLVIINGVEVGIFRVCGAFYAWRNVCPHQGGPVCQGRIFKRVIEDIRTDCTVHGQRYEEDVLHIVCPWHGAEFDIRTGRHAGTNTLVLCPVKIIIHDGEVFINVQ